MFEGGSALNALAKTIDCGTLIVIFREQLDNFGVDPRLERFVVNLAVGAAERRSSTDARQRERRIEVAEYVLVDLVARFAGKAEK